MFSMWRNNGVQLMKVITTTKEYNEKGQIVKETVVEENRQDNVYYPTYPLYPQRDTTNPYEPFRVT